MSVSAAAAAAPLLRSAPAAADDAEPPPQNNEVWDLHTHINPVPGGGSPAERMARLLEYASRMGVDRLVTFMGYPWTYHPTPEQLRKENDQVLKAIRAHPDRAFGFAYVSGEHVQASLEEIDRCIRDGPMVGIKLWVSMRMNNPAVMPILERAADLKAVIFQHTWMKVGGDPPRRGGGSLPGGTRPTDIAEVARRMPEVPLVCGHAGGDWEPTIRAVRDTPNVSLGTSGNDPTAGLVEMAVRELGADRVIYGSDAGGRGFASQLAKVHAAHVPEQAKRLILGANLRRMMRPILRRKGIKL